MANYTKSTDFAAKDSLSSGDSNKVVRGTEFETEFDAISTSIATKADTAGPTFSGTTTIPTVDINGGAIDGTTIGAASASPATLTNLTASGTINFSGATVSNLGTVTTANIDGGTVDGAVIGGASAAAGTFTTLAASSATVGGAAVLTSVTFSNMDAGAITTSSETFANSDTQIPTNAAVKAHVEAVIPTLTVTESSVTAHQAALAIAATQITSLTSTVSELNILDGVTSTASELNILDGVTSTATELNLVDGSTADTVVNSKAVVYGAAGQITANELDVDNIQIDANAVKSTDTNGNIQLFPNGTGFTELYGNTNAGTIRFNCENNSHGVTVQGPAHSATATYTVKLPDTLGLTQVSGLVSSDANGVVTYANGTIDQHTTVTSSSNAATINLRDGNVFEHDLTENVTYTFSNPGASGTASLFVLKIIQDSSARTITWPSSVDWAAATAPTITTTNNGVDVFVFFTIDGGTTYYGFTAGQAMG